MYLNHELGPILDFFSYFEILCCPTHICLKIQRFRGSSIDGFSISLYLLNFYECYLCNENFMSLAHIYSTLLKWVWSDARIKDLYFLASKWTFCTWNTLCRRLTELAWWGTTWWDPGRGPVHWGEERSSQLSCSLDSLESSYGAISCVALNGHS